MEAQLPPIFAVFDSKSLAHRNPFFWANRFWVYRSYERDSRVGIGCYREKLRFDVRRCQDPPLKVLLHTSHVYWWLTGYEIHPKGGWHTHTIPVLDFYDTDFIHGPHEFRQTAENDENGICFSRMMDMQRVFREMSADVPQPPPPSAPAVDPVPSPPLSRSSRPASKLPLYVASLLVADAKKKGESCPISMTPLESCTRIAITDCYHCFDAESLERWLATSLTCPMCKQPQTTAPQLVS